MDSPHKGTVTWKMFPFDDVIMETPVRNRSASTPGALSIFDKTSYPKILWYLEATSLAVEIDITIWNFTGRNASKTPVKFDSHCVIVTIHLAASRCQILWYDILLAVKTARRELSGDTNRMWEIQGPEWTNDIHVCDICMCTYEDISLSVQCEKFQLSI